MDKVNIEEAAEKYAGINYSKNHDAFLWDTRRLGFIAGAEWLQSQLPIPINIPMSKETFIQTLNHIIDSGHNDIRFFDFYDRNFKEEPITDDEWVKKLEKMYDTDEIGDEV